MFASLARGILRSPANAYRIEHHLQRHISYYQILGVQQTATTAEIKTAFRRKAVELHPDSSSTKQQQDPQTTQQWHNVLLSYQILSDPRSRELYDLSLIEHSSSFIGRAARNAAAAEDDFDHHNIDITWGLGSWLDPNKSESSKKKAKEAGTLDTIRSELQRDFQSALKQAYLGPRLNDLQPGQLPQCFEAEERSTHDISRDVLLLVSGRHILGAVRQSTPELLSNDQFNCLKLDRRSYGNRLSSGEQQQEALTQVNDADVETSYSPAVLVQAETRQQDTSQAPSANHEPEVLDIILDDDDDSKVSATAVRYLDPNQGSARIDVLLNTADNDSQRTSTLLATIQSNETAASASTTLPSTLDIFNSNGVLTHTVYRSFSPLVRHITFLTAAQNVNRRRVIARCHRAWLPASRLWLFRPVSWSHDIGGWSIEWIGYEKEGHSMWIDPSVVLAVCAFDTLDHEKKGRQPAQGVFSGNGEGGGGRWKWVGDILKFHKSR